MIGYGQGSTPENVDTVEDDRTQFSWARPTEETCTSQLKREAASH